MKRTFSVLAMSTCLLMGTVALAQELQVSPDLANQSFSVSTDLGDIQFSAIPAVKNQTKTDARQQLSDFVKNIQSATGQFAQETVGGNNPQPPSSGDFAFQRNGGKFSWHIRKPYEQHIVSDGRIVSQYDPDLMQVTERTIKGALGSSPAAILFGKGNLENNFTVQILPESEGMVWLRATPKVADEGMNYIDIAFANNLPAELRILDSFGQTTHIKLRNFKSNVSIANKTFQLNLPNNVERVRLD
ncbi:outer membrane lipoprotein carrier protein LolA [Pelistega sp. NLN82]|uniref:Outer-membrane lipoprotein carrier protein n=1 Tax=Pelistega ratti TaxID=2652177 RepID=A0A6L9Y5A6_9BURK|nr:outer membrane lipoprotein carrier protein LolA [Pelistega ratti]NEN74988.1 outer membrane lipoprotein carrier protein LolA [Pelistega ratti]